MSDVHWWAVNHWADLHRQEALRGMSSRPSLREGFGGGGDGEKGRRRKGTAVLYISTGEQDYKHSNHNKLESRSASASSFLSARLLPALPFSFVRDRSRGKSPALCICRGISGTARLLSLLGSVTLSTLHQPWRASWAVR